MIKEKNALSPKHIRPQRAEGPFKSLHSSVSQPHTPFLGTLQTFTPLERCPYHDEEIQFCCFDCKQMCCCSKCLITGNHQTHDVKNIHRGYCMVEALLNEFTVKLGARAELYSLWHEKISIGKSEVVEDYLQLKRVVNSRFSDLRDLLERKNAELLEQIDNARSQKEEFLSQHLVKLRVRIKLNHDSQNIVETNIQQLSEPSLCKYYSEMRDHLQLLTTEDIEAELRFLTVRPKYKIDHAKLETVRNSLHQLSDLYSIEPQTVKKAVVRATFNIPNIPDDDTASFSNSQSHSVLLNKRRHPRDSYPSPQHPTPPVSRFQQPEAYAKVRPSFGLLKSDSRKTFKMFSANSSPFKQKKQSPLHYLEMQKKYFIKGKQNQ